LPATPCRTTGPPGPTTCSAPRTEPTCSEYRDASRGVYRAARVLDDRLESCVLVGPGPERAAAEAAFATPAHGAFARAALLSGAGLDGAAARDPGPLVCACRSVGERAILGAIAARRCATAADLGRLPGAGITCGSCLPELHTLLARPAALAA
jgi:assimilatory nitrate reductase catalytic subunit